MFTQVTPVSSIPPWLYPEIKVDISILELGIPEFEIHISKRHSDQLSVHTAEMVAVIISLQWVKEVRPDRVVVCTDSIAVLERCIFSTVCSDSTFYIGEKVTMTLVKDAE